MPETRLPSCWLPDLIHSQMASGNFGKVVDYAIAEARRRNQPEMITLFSNMLCQIQDYWADIGKGGGVIGIRLDDE